jgi:hypothetical protein
VCILALGSLVAWLAGAAPANSLPRFTEEREAAAQYFVKKHLPELLPLLDRLKKDNSTEYQRQISEIFQATEILAEMRDDAPRHDLELRIWITENRAQVLIARLSTPDAEERKRIQAQLQELARQLVSLDMDFLELKVEQLDRELGEAKDELNRIRDHRDKHVKERYEGLLQRVKKTKN